MTDKQKRFCDEYLIDLNATQAAIRAGYSSKYANTNASKLLQNTTIKKYLDERLKKMQDESIAKARAVVKGGQSVKAQIDWLKGRRIHIHPSCKNLLKEMQQWRWQRDEKLDEYTDEPVPIFDDAIAALRYGVEGWRKHKEIIIPDRSILGGL